MNQQTNYGGTNLQVNTDENNTNYFTISEQKDEIIGIPDNLPRTHIKIFMGREAELEQLHELLSHQQLASVTGMGGIGKSELVLQYAQFHLEEQTYCGGICWLKARETDVGSQIISFARTRLGLSIPEKLQKLEDQVGYCWSHWKLGKVLLVLDDVTDYEQIRPYLPADSRFKILITTRLYLGQVLQPLKLQVLQPDTALELLRSLTKRDRIDSELVQASSLCKWLGYLPLGLELVGRYLEGKPDLSLAEMQKRLESQKLDSVALKRSGEGMTAQLGVAAAFELSWQELTPDAQTLCYLLSLFALSPVRWDWVKDCLPDWECEKLEEMRDTQLVRLSLLERTGQQMYRLHQLIWEFFQAKANQTADQEGVDQLKRSLCRVMVGISRSVPEPITLTDIRRLEDVMPHLETVVQTLVEFFPDEELFFAFLGVGGFYYGRGLYGKTESWFYACLEATRTRLGESHQHVARSLNNLAQLYHSLARYEESERTFLEALAIYQQTSHPYAAAILNNLAELYESQERYEEAESSFRQALKISQQQLGADHPDIAKILNNLAMFYRTRERYKEAEPLFRRALKISQQQLGADHPDIAKILSNLAEIYYYQNRYEEAESSFHQALEISQQQLGADHPDIADIVNNLATFYQARRRYKEAEPLFRRALEISQQQLGADHPDIVTRLNNLAVLYYYQNRYEEAESLFLQAIPIAERSLGEQHPITIRLREQIQYVQGGGLLSSLFKFAIWAGRKLFV